MFEGSKKKFALGAALSVPLSGLALTTEPAAAVTPPPAPKNHCVTAELSAAQLASGVKSSITCYPTFAEAMASIGISVSAGTTATTFTGTFAGTTASSNVLAIHYLDTGGGGGSLSVTGDDCGGGGLSLSAPYDDAISSTRNYLCSNVKHFDNPDFSGGAQNVAGGWGSLTNLNATLNDHTSSIRYYGPLN